MSIVGERFDYTTGSGSESLRAYTSSGFASGTVTGGFIGLVNVGTETLNLSLQDSTDPDAEIRLVQVVEGQILIIGADTTVILSDSDQPSNVLLDVVSVTDGTYTNPVDGESYVVANGMMSYTVNGQSTDYGAAGISLPQTGYRGPIDVIFINTSGANLLMTSSAGSQVLQPLEFYLALTDIEYTFA